MSDLAIYAALFGVSFLAATLFPAQSELALASLIVSGSYSPWVLVAVASAGNVAGSILNWVLGRAAEQFRHRRWFPISATSLDNAQGWYLRYGRWSLLLSWMPIIGDPLTVAAGFLREPLWSFVLLVTIAKTGRYIVLALVTLGVM